jgi:predicted small lipoprotein YifL
MRAAALGLILLLAGCGQAGDLYLPSEPAATPAPAGPEATPPAGAEEKKKDRK